VGEAYLTELIHQRPYTWKGDVERLFALLEELGDAHFRLVLQRVLFQRLIGADHVVTPRRPCPSAGLGHGGRVMTRVANRPARPAPAARRPTRRGPADPPAPVRDLDGMLKRLHLPTVRRLYADLATRAEADGMSYRTYLETLIAEEIAHRSETRLTRAVRKARFPFLRTIDDFNFTFQTALKLQMLGSYLGPELVTEGRSAIFSGPSGTGKSHLCVAIAYRAIQHGYEARFVGADELIGAHAADAANVLYRVVNERYLRRRPMLLTTNKPLAALGDVLHDGDLAEAILDRLLEHGAHFAMRGRSYRTRHLTEEDQASRRAKTA
jgi:DNA replication protein DnaC